MSRRIVFGESYDPAVVAAAAPAPAIATETAMAAEPEAELLGAVAPEPASVREAAHAAPIEAEPAPVPAEEAPVAQIAGDDELIAEAAPLAPVMRATSRTEPAEHAGLHDGHVIPSPGSPADGFTDFSPIQAPQPSLAVPRDDLIDALPNLLPVFADLANTADRPFGTMPEVMPPPPLRPILPPELQDEGPRPGLFSRMLGRK